MIMIRRWWWGIPPEPYVRWEHVIGEFITKNKIPAVSRDIISDRTAQIAGGVIIDGRTVLLAGGVVVTEGLQASDEIAARSTAQKVPPRIGPLPFPGGMKGPHLHFKGDVYMLDAKQWGDFSQNIMNNIQERLGRAKSVSFDQLMEIAEATDGLA